MARRSLGPAAGVLLAWSAVASAAEPVPDDAWVALFDGRTLDGWTPKIRGYPAGENFAQTFRVEDGLLTVGYDGYEAFDDRFGHLFHAGTWSHYRIRLAYRFLGDPAPGAPRWAWRNSGIMLHAQDPGTMPADQDFPIAIEFQFLGGLGDGEARPTGAVCSPGTHVAIGGERAADHCIAPAGPTIDGDGWVQVEALVLGDERIVHYVEGEPVLAYGALATGGGVVSGHDPAMKPEDGRLASGGLALQSEGHPIQFRDIEILNLRGCMDPTSPAFRSWHVAPDPAACGQAD